MATAMDATPAPVVANAPVVGGDEDDAPAPPAAAAAAVESDADKEARIKARPTLLFARHTPLSLTLHPLERDAVRACSRVKCVPNTFHPIMYDSTGRHRRRR